MVNGEMRPGREFQPEDMLEFWRGIMEAPAIHDDRVSIYMAVTNVSF